MRDLLSKLSDGEARAVAQQMCLLLTKSLVREKMVQVQVENLQEQLLSRVKALPLSSDGQSRSKSSRGEDPVSGEDEEGDEEVELSDVMDETFYPSDEERKASKSKPREESVGSSNSGSGSGSSEAAGVKERKGPQHKTKRPPVEILAKPNKRHKTQPSTEGKSVDTAVVPLSQYTVKELKAFLKERGLSVTGSHISVT